MLILTVLGFVVGGAIAPGTSLAQTPVDDTTNAISQRSDITFHSHNTTLPGSAPPPKLSSGVAREIVKATDEPSGAGIVTSQQPTQETIEVQLTVAPSASQSVQNTIIDTGGKIRVAFDDGIVAAVPLDAIGRLREMEAVNRIRLPETGQTTEITKGTEALSADTVQNNGTTGQGVRVAVIDTEFDADNPAISDNVIRTKNIRSGEPFSNISDGHGTATAEVITDTAPNVSLILISTPDISETGVERALQFADQNTSADVITMSLSFPTGPFDGSSKMSELITNATQNGTPVFVSAGNYADKNHLNTSFTDGDNDGVHNFSSSNERLTINTSVLEESDSLDIFVNWNDYAFSGTNDFNLTLRNNSGAVVRVSENRQPNFGPTEDVSLSNPTDGPYTLSITGDPNNSQVEFNIFTIESELNQSTTQQSVARPAVGKKSLAVGAVSAESRRLRSFSSRGPTVDGRQKPDLVAPDGVNTSVDSFSRYFGTSASAPHAAGVAALMIEEQNSLTATQLTSTLTDTANTQSIDGTPTEPNNQTGAGLVDAASVVADVQPDGIKNISSCQDITAPGRYEITGTINVTDDQDCINIQADDVTLNGNNNIIRYDDFGELSNFNAIEALSATNVTVQNVEIRYFNDAVEFTDVSNGAIVDVTTQTGFEYSPPPTKSLQSNGIVLRDGSENNTVQSNDLFDVGDGSNFDSSGNGIYVTDSNNNTITDNEVSIPGNVGVRLENASGNNVSANEVSAGGITREPGLAYGIIVAADSDRNLVADNLLRGNSIGEQNGQTGITVTRLGVGPPAEYASSDYNQIVDNEIKNFAFDGISAFDNNATTIVGNDIDGSNEYGVYVGNVDSANLTNNIVEFSGQADGEANVFVSATNLTLIGNEANSGDGDGFEIQDVQSATILNNTASNDGADFELVNTTTLSVENLNLLNYEVTFSGKNISMSLNDTRAALPGSYEDVHLLDAGKTHDDGFANLTMTYNENRIKSTLDLNESTLAFWNRTRNWSEVPEAKFDTEINTVAVNLTTETNLTADSTYAIAGIDDITPTITAYNVTSSGTDLTTSFTASEQLSALTIEIENESGLRRTLGLADFTERQDIQTDVFNYSATTTLPEGNYTVALVNTSDKSNNNASVTKTKSIILDAFLAIENASIVDLEDADGTVLDGDQVQVSTTIDGTNIQSVEANATQFGGSAAVSLSDPDNDEIYNGTFTVDVDADDSPQFTVNISDGAQAVNVSVRDIKDRTAARLTNTLALDTSTFIEGATISDATDGDGNVTDGDRIDISATPSRTDVGSLVANASDFGGPEVVSLSDNNDDGTYTGSFTVGANTSGNGLQSVEVTLTSENGQTISGPTNAITVDTSAPTVSRITDDEVAGSLNVSRVRDGNVVLIKVFATDDGTGLNQVIANASAFGVDQVPLTETSLDFYSGTFTVDAADAKADGNYDLPVTAFDGVGTSDTQNLSLYMNNTGNSEPPGLSNPSAVNLDGPNNDVQGGDRIDVSVEASDIDGGIDTIYANASAFGTNQVSLTKISSGSLIYNGTFTVDSDDASASGEHAIDIVATDRFDNTARTSTENLTTNFDTTPPQIISASPSSSATVVNDSTVLEANVEVLQRGSNVTSVTMNLSSLGAGTLTLTETDTQNVYNGTYSVNTTQASEDGQYAPNVTVTDAGGNTVTQRTSDFGQQITLDTESPVITSVTATSLDGSSDVARDGDEIKITAEVTDDNLFTNPITANASVFGAGKAVPLEFVDGNQYAATFSVNGSEASPDGSYTIPIAAVDGAGNVANTTTDSLELNTSSSGDGGPIEVDVDPSDLSGDGSESTPYEISNVSELQAMEDDLDANYELVSDIDASNTAQWNNGSGFDPIGSQASEFSGSVDGNNHTVAELTIARPNETQVGLFGVSVGTLTEITLTNATVTGNISVGRVVGTVSGDSRLQGIIASGEVSGDKDVGGVAGVTSGSSTLRDVTASGNVNSTQDQNVGGLVGGTFDNSTIRNATASGNVIGGPFNTGGLIGDNNGNVISVIVTTDVSGIEDVGGLVGDNNGGTIRDAKASGSVNGSGSVGGLVGDNDGTIVSGVATGDITGAEDVGGLSGDNEEDATIRNATASGSVSGTDNVGGVVGNNQGTIIASTGAGNVNGSDGIGGLVGDNDGEGTDDGIVSRSSASGEVTGQDDVGGLVGSNFGGRISLSAATGSVTAQSSFADAGGLVGGNFRGGIINQSYARGPVSGETVGGLVGENFNESQVLNSYATGTINDPGSGNFTGGLIGGNFQASRVNDSYWDTQATGQSTSDGDATGLTTAQMQGESAQTNMSGFDFENTWTTQTDPDDYPTLIALPQQTELDQPDPDPEPIPKTAVTFENQTVVNGSTSVTVASAQFGNQSVPGEEFVVVVHETDDGEIGTKIGESPVLEGNQTNSNITVNLSKDLGPNDGVSQLSESQELVAMLHLADTGDGDNINHGANNLSADTPTPVTDRAQVGPLGLQTVSTNITQTGNSLNQPGQPVEITATVQNAGATDDTIQLTFIRDRDGDGDTEQLNTQNVAVGSETTRTVSVTVTPAQTETFSVQAPASSQNVTINVANLSLTDATLVTQEPVTTTETVVVNATVRNDGDASGVIPLTLRENGTPVETTVQTVGVGETVTTQLTASFSEGTQNLTVTSSLANQSATVGEIVVAPPEAVTNATVRVGSGSVGPGGTTTVNLTLDQAPQGLAGYNLTARLSVADSGVRVIEASAPTVFNDSVTETTIDPDNQTAEIRATDITEVVDTNATNASLGTVTVAANESANVSQRDLRVSVERIDDDSGTPINVTTQNGTVTVREQGPLAPGLNPPTDPDNDGVFEDVNGNGRVDFSDVVALFENLPDARAPFQDVNGNGRIDFDDIVELFQEI